MTTLVDVTAAIPSSVTDDVYLNAWVDFNQDGVWDDDQEHIFRDETLVDGLNPLRFFVPTWATPTSQGAPAVARFRMSTEHGLGYWGEAPDGEVEDYALEILFGAPDTDGDGVPDEVEEGAPGGDGDGDGTPDALQSGVASLPNLETGGYVTLVVTPPVSLHDVRPHPDPPHDAGSEGMDFAAACFEFELRDVPASGLAHVTMYLHESAAWSTYYSYGGLPSYPADHWYPFLASSPGAEILGDRIELLFEDGERGDHDLTSNGAVTHLGGPAINRHSEPWQNPRTREDVSNDYHIAPNDVLLVINKINRDGSQKLPVPPVPPELPPFYYDVSGDNHLSPVDALIVINDLNEHGPRRVPPVNTKSSSRGLEIISRTDVAAEASEGESSGDLLVLPPLMDVRSAGHSATLPQLPALDAVSLQLDRGFARYYQDRDPQWSSLGDVRSAAVPDRLGIAAKADRRPLVTEELDDRWDELLDELADDVLPLWTDIAI